MLEIQNLILAEISTLVPDVPAEMLSADASMTAELGLDSVHLTSLFALIRQEIGPVELAPWFIRASHTGEDSIASLAAYISYRLTPQRAAS